MNSNVISAECGHLMHSACTFESCACTCHFPENPAGDYDEAYLDSIDNDEVE